MQSLSAPSMNTTATINSEAASSSSSILATRLQRKSGSNMVGIGTQIKGASERPAFVVRASFPSTLTFAIPVGPSEESEQALKEWVWKTYQDEIFASMGITVCVSESDDSIYDVAPSTVAVRKQQFLKEKQDAPSATETNSTLTSTDSSNSSFRVEETSQLVESPSSSRATTTTTTTRMINALEQQVADRTLKLQQANAALETANRVILEESQRQLEHFACMSHEIRTPLNCIIGLSNLLIQDTTSDLPAQYKESIKMINSSGELLLNVVNDVLDYAKYEAGKIEFDITRTNLQDTLESILRPVSSKAHAERHINLRSFFDVSVPEFIHTDGRRLQQILFNLLGNAIKFSEDGSLVELHLKVCPPAFSNLCSPLCGKGEVITPSNVMQDAILTAAEQQQSSDENPPREVSTSPETKNVLRFTVKDYGKGIKECDFERIFQPFLQASDEKDNVHGGTGLGLPITGKLVTGLGGTIYVDSVVGEWTAFTVDFPFVDSLPDNMEAVAKCMSNTTVFFVFDDCFPGTVANFELVCNLYKVQERTFANFDAMDVFVDREGNLDQDRTYICFCFDVQYRAASYARLAAKAKSVLLTFGPQRLVKETQGHYGCPNSVLPAVLMDSFCPYVTDDKPVAVIVPDISIVSFADLKVLVAEDNLVNQKVLQMMLNKIGLHNSDMVCNGQEAVDQEARQEYDVVLLDMQMPVMDGLEACQLIRKRYKQRTDGPKIAFVTAQVSSSFRTLTVEAGAKAFLAKPFTLSGITRCLEELLEPDPCEVAETFID